MSIHASDGPPGPPVRNDSQRAERVLYRGGVDGQPVGGSATRIIVVHDRRPETFRRLAEALAGCQLRLRWVPDRPTIAQLRPDDCGIALVAVAGEPNASSPALETVAVLKRKGYTVLCYWEGAAGWALGAQCRLLLSGASHVMDSADAAFVADLRERLQHLVNAQAERQRENRRIRQQMLGLGVVGVGPGITSVFRWVLRVSPLSDLPVLTIGETGTGKELVARAIHRLDPRRCDGPFLPVNCGAISAGVAESELFGHRRGAFTGAERDRKGHVRAAQGGVLFLDEIGDLEANLQGKLLRVLQEHRVLALGEDQEVPVDVRIIAATNRDLEDMVRKHAFRADLFHRLNVLSIRIPALRERPEDIEPLVQHFVTRCADPASESAVSASREFMQALRRVELPGNVRQLENVVRRALVSEKRGDQLRLSDLPPELLAEIAQVAGSANAQARSPDVQAPPPAASEAARQVDGHSALLDAVAVLEASNWKLGHALGLCEQKIVAAALGVSSGNRSRAARLLGISPRSIFNKMRKYDISI